MRRTVRILLVVLAFVGLATRCVELHEHEGAPDASCALCRIVQASWAAPIARLDAPCIVADVASPRGVEESMVVPDAPALPSHRLRAPPCA